MTKLKIDLRSGLVEVEADADLANKIYSDFKGVMIERMMNGSLDHPISDGSAISASPSDSGKRKSRPKGAGGPSCASRIEELKNEGFFKALRDPKQISQALSEKAQNYQSNQIAAALTTLTKRGALRRVKQDGAFKYQNP